MVSNETIADKGNPSIIPGFGERIYCLNPVQYVNACAQRIAEIAKIDFSRLASSNEDNTPNLSRSIIYWLEFVTIDLPKAQRGIYNILPMAAESGLTRPMDLVGDLPEIKLTQDSLPEGLLDSTPKESWLAAITIAKAKLQTIRGLAKQYDADFSFEADDYLKLLDQIVEQVAATKGIEVVMAQILYHAGTEQVWQVNYGRPLTTAIIIGLLLSGCTGVVGGFITLPQSDFDPRMTAPALEPTLTPTLTPTPTPTVKPTSTYVYRATPQYSPPSRFIPRSTPVYIPTSTPSAEVPLNEGLVSIDSLFTEVATNSGEQLTMRVSTKTLENLGISDGFFVDGETLDTARKVMLTYWSWAMAQNSDDPRLAMFKNIKYTDLDTVLDAYARNAALGAAGFDYNFDFGAFGEERVSGPVDNVVVSVVGDLKEMEAIRQYLYDHGIKYVRAQGNNLIYYDENGVLQVVTSGQSHRYNPEKKYSYLVSSFAVSMGSGEMQIRIASGSTPAFSDTQAIWTLFACGTAKCENTKTPFEAWND